MRVLRCCECVCLPRPFECVTMGSAVLFMFIFRKVWYEQSGSFLSGFCVKLLCFVQANIYVGMIA